MIYGNAIRHDDLKDAGLEVDFKKLAADALAAMNAYGTDGRTFEEAAIERVNGMKEEYGNGVSTLIMFFNATGCTMKFDELEDISGHLFKYQPDPIVYNGQWSCFLHVKTSGAATGSFGKFGYWLRGEEDGSDPLFTVSWDTPWSGRNAASASFFDNDDFATAMTAAGGDIAKIARIAAAVQARGPYTAKVDVSQNSSPILRVVATRKSLL